MSAGAPDWQIVVIVIPAPPGPIVDVGYPDYQIVVIEVEG